MDAFRAVITFGVGLGGVTLGAVLARRNDRRAQGERLLVDALNDAVRAIANVAGGAGPEAQRQYASAVARVALHGSPEVVAAFRVFQNDATTTTQDGRDRLLAVLRSARAELGHRMASDSDLAVLLFGAGPVDVELWTRTEEQVRESIGPELEVVESRQAGAIGDDDLEELLALAEQAPITAIKAAYEAVEEHVRRLGIAAGIDAASTTSVASLSRALLKEGLIDAKDDNALAGLVTLRNLAVHGPSPQSRRASEFIVLAEAVMFSLAGTKAAALAVSEGD